MENKNRYEEHIETNFESFIGDLIDLVRIPSVYREDSTRKPFGGPIDRALKKTLEICERLGLKTYYHPEGYYGYAEIGQGQDMIGILGHLDVVPAGDLKEWMYHPFDPTEKNGKIYGRGTQDDKGPLLAAVYAVKALELSGAELNKRIRFIFGTDEETLWRGIKVYEKSEEMPSIGFSPDSNFPLIYAEKGLLQVKLSCENDLGFEGAYGDAFNSVPSEAVYQGPHIDKLSKALDDLEFKYESMDGGLSVTGKSFHAKEAEKGINAVARLCMGLDKVGVRNPAIQFSAKEIGQDALGREIFGAIEDKASGHLKVNLGMLNLGRERSEICLDLRIPVTVKKEDIESQLRETAHRYGLTYEEHDYLPSIYVPQDSKLVKGLMKAYQDISGDQESLPISSGGATYARAMKNCVAFGAVFPGKAKTEHKPNEYISKADIKKAMRIYAQAVLELMRV